jgi:membrane-bound lytic murein transglycosylase D
LNWYTVKHGDTLPVIAKRLHVSRADLAAANYLAPTAHVSPGQKLAVPHETTVLMAARTERGVPVQEARAIGGEFTTMPAPVTSGRIKVSYEVRRGDTLSSVARLFRTSVASLRTWNAALSSRLTPGQRLTVYTSRRTN